jgi:hypothetical protein
MEDRTNNGERYSLQFSLKVTGGENQPGLAS